MDMQKVEKLNSIVQGSRNIVFFGGAGVSTESGLPDFRSTDGLYRQTYNYPPEVMLSRSFYERHPEEFFAFYKEKLLLLGIQPNPAHCKLAQWEREGRLRAVITQNIDGLHQKAGSRHVIELHGSVHRNTCPRCRRSYTAEYVKAAPGVPQCECGGTLKPDVVLYEEPLDQGSLRAAEKAIREADVLIIGGTSLAVYPAAGLVHHFGGRHLVLVNKSEASLHTSPQLTLTDPIGEVFAKLT